MMKLAFAFFALCVASSAYSDEDFAGGMPDMDAFSDMMGGMGGYGGYGGMGGYDDYGGYSGYGDKPEAPVPPPPRELASVDEILAFIGETGTEATVIGYFDTTRYGDDLAIFTEVAERIGNEYRFGFTTEKSALQEAKVEGLAVYIYKPYSFVNSKYEKIRSRYPSSHLKATALEKFIAEKSQALVGEKRNRHVEQEVLLFMDVNHDKNEKQFQYYANRMRKVAKDVTERKLVFNIADKMEHTHLLKNFDFDFSDSKVAVGIMSGHPSNARYYRMESAFSVDNLRSFVNAYINGDLVGTEVQQASSSGEFTPSEHVIAATEADFASVVATAPTDILVEFYAPWCGHCKALAPEYNALADSLHEQGVEVGVVSYDADANTVPEGFDVQGFPTIMFIPKSTRVPEVYNGARDAASMEAFVKERVGK